MSATSTDANEPNIEFYNWLVQRFVADINATYNDPRTWLRLLRDHRHIFPNNMKPLLISSCILYNAETGNAFTWNNSLEEINVLLDKIAESFGDDWLDVQTEPQ